MQHFTIFHIVRYFTFVAVMGMLPIAASAQPPAATPVDPLQAGIDAAVDTFKKSDIAGTLEQLKALYGQYPSLAPPQVFMAQLFAKAGLGEAARASLEAAITETPSDPEAYILLGEILLQQRYFAAADLLLKEAIGKLDAYTVDSARKKMLRTAWFRNAIILADARGQWNAVLQLLDAAIVQDGETPVQLRQKGVALFQLKREMEALAQFAKADALPQAAEQQDSGLPAEAMMAQLYQMRGDKENAQKYLAAALQKYPKSKEVVILSIQSRLYEDKLEDAKRLAETLVTEYPTWLPGKSMLATIALYLGDYAGAEKLFQELILASPSDEQITNGLALAQCEQNNPQKLQLALRYAEANVNKNQQVSDHWATYAWVLYKDKQYEKAEQALKRATATGQVTAATAYYMACVSLQKERKEDAIQLLKDALGTPAPFAKRREAAKMLETLKE